MGKGLIKFAAAAGIYAVFAAYLYQPYFGGSGELRLRDLFVVNVCLACTGCYVLSRRWMSVFAASLFAGAAYGFGPFTISLAKYHPATGLLAATIPWLFCPAAYLLRQVRSTVSIPKLNPPYDRRIKWQWLQIPLSMLPFLIILLFFQASTHYRLFPVSIQDKLHLPDLLALFVPLVAAEHNLNLVSFYHIPIAALIVGFSMLLAARRFGIMAILIIGTILAFCNSFLNVSPVIWPAIPLLCCSVLIGAGIQGLLWAGFADRKWLLATAFVMAALSIAALLPTTKYASKFIVSGPEDAKLFAETARMYLLGAIVTVVLYLLVYAKLRVHWLRLVILCSAMAADIFFGARFIVDKIF